MLRLVTTYLMLLALPLQGWAAAQMLHCAGSAPPAVQPHDGAHAHHHAPEGQAKKATAGCSACAACCVALALPSRVTPLAGPVAEGAPPRPLQAAPVSFVTGGPERPPRASFA